MVAVVRVNRKTPDILPLWEIDVLCRIPCYPAVTAIVKDMWVLGVTKQPSTSTKFSADVPQRKWTDLETSRAAIRCFEQMISHKVGDVRILWVNGGYSSRTI